MKKFLKLSAIAALLIGSSSSAIEFTPIGYKAISMGGAGVASAGSSLAGYYNPALLGKVKTTVEISLGGGLSARDNGAGESVQKLNDSGFTEAYNRLNNDPTEGGNLAQVQKDRQTLLDSKNIILDMDGKGVILNPDAYIGAQIMNFGFGIYGQTEGAGAAEVDTTRTKLIVGNDTDGYVDVETNAISSKAEYESSSMVYAAESGLTYLDINAIVLAEVPLSYGHNFETSLGDVSVGASLKFMRGTTYAGKVNIDTAGSNITDALSNSETTSSTFGFDLGVLYEPSMVHDLHLGLVGKNLNSPSFGVSGRSDYTLDPMLRLGVAYDIFDSLEVAFDMDLTKNKTAFKDFDTQYMGGGANFHMSWFSVRAGLMSNTASSLEGLIYTGGVAVGPSFLQLDLSGQYASNTAMVDGTSYPTYSKINVALISRW